MHGRVAKTAVRSALTFKLLEFLVSFIAKGFGPFLREFGPKVGGLMTTKSLA